MPHATAADLTRDATPVDADLSLEAALEQLVAAGAEGARAFADYLVSPAFQAPLASYPGTSNPAFFADAAPHVGLTTPIAANAFAGKSVGLSLAAANVAPGAAPMTGAVVHVLRTIGTGAPTEIAQGVVDGNGFASIPFAVNRTASYTATVGPYRDLQGTSLALGSVNAKASIKLRTAKTSGHRVLVTGTFTPTSLQHHPRLSLYSKRKTGGWHVIAKISANARGRSPSARGRWRSAASGSTSATPTTRASSRPPSRARSTSR